MVISVAEEVLQGQQKLPTAQITPYRLTNYLAGVLPAQLSQDSDTDSLSKVWKKNHKTPFRPIRRFLQ